MRRQERSTPGLRLEAGNMSKINNYYQGTEVSGSQGVPKNKPLASTEEILKVKGNKAFKTKIKELIQNEN